MKVRMRNYPFFVCLCVPFEGNNVFATKIDGVYAIYSYGRHWPLAACDMITGEWVVNTDKASVTTSKHLTACQIPHHATPMNKTGVANFIEDRRYRNFLKKTGIK